MVNLVFLDTERKWMMCLKFSYEYSFGTSFILKLKGYILPLRDKFKKVNSFIFEDTDLQRNWVFIKGNIVAL